MARGDGVSETVGAGAPSAVVTRPVRPRALLPPRPRPRAGARAERESDPEEAVALVELPTLLLRVSASSESSSAPVSESLNWLLPESESVLMSTRWTTRCSPLARRSAATVANGALVGSEISERAPRGTSGRMRTAARGAAAEKESRILLRSFERLSSLTT